MCAAGVSSVVDPEEACETAGSAEEYFKAVDELEDLGFFGKMPREALVGRANIHRPVRRAGRPRLRGSLGLLPMIAERTSTSSRGVLKPCRWDYFGYISTSTRNSPSRKETSENRGLRSRENG